MGVYTGCRGAIEKDTVPATSKVPISSVRQWQISESRSTIKYGASNTHCAAGRLAGKFAWSGSYNAYGSVPSLMPRESALFRGYHAPLDGIVGGTGTTLSGEIIVDSVAITWNWENQEPISHVVNFSGVGLLTQTLNDTAIIDATAIDLDEVCPSKIDISDNIGTPNWETISNIKQAILNISAENKKYTDSSTLCAEASIKGPIDWTLSIDRNNDIWDASPGGVPSVPVLPILSGNDYALRLYDSVAEFWELDYAIMKDHTNILTDIETDAIIGYTENYEMQAWVDASGDGVRDTLGKILFPSTAEWWPTNIA